MLCTDGRALFADGRVLCSDGRMLCADGRLLCANGTVCDKPNTVRVSGCVIAQTVRCTIMQAVRFEM
jgi:hypothetical protein